MQRDEIEHQGIRKREPKPTPTPRHKTCTYCEKRFSTEANSQVNCDKCKGRHTLTGRWIRIKRGAEKRGHLFALTLRDLEAHWQKPCTYCGAYIRSVQLDRVDNKKGYVVGNVVPCCFPCNHLKGSMAQGKFLDQVRRIADHQKPQSGAE